MAKSVVGLMCRQGFNVIVKHKFRLWHMGRLSKFNAHAICTSHTSQGYFKFANIMKSENGKQIDIDRITGLSDIIIITRGLALLRVCSFDGV